LNGACTGIYLFQLLMVINVLKKAVFPQSDTAKDTNKEIARKDESKASK